MGKDGGGGDGYGGYSYSAPVTNTMYDVHIATLQIIENQLARLHKTLERGDGDDDTTQELISDLQNELVRLSKQFADAETK